MHRSAVSKTGYDSYPFHKDRWACASQDYPNFIPRKFALQAQASTGNNWDDFVYFNPISEEGVVSADRMRCTYYFKPIDPLSVRLLFLTIQSYTGPGPSRQLNVTIDILGVPVINWYHHQSYVFPGLFGKFLKVPVGGWKDTGVYDPTPPGYAACHYQIDPLYWRNWTPPYVDP